MARRFIHLSNLLLILIVVYFSVEIFYEFVEFRLYLPLLPDTSGKPVLLAETKRDHGVFSNYNIIADRDLFATMAAVQKDQPEIDIGKLEHTGLNLKLWGTVSAEDRKSAAARAVIEESRLKRQRLYRVGDTVEHARISEIHRKSVILDVRGRKEKLMMEKNISAPGNITTSRENPPPVGRVMAVSGSEGRKISLKRPQVENAFQNLNKLMSEVKIRPYFRDGNPAGFIVANIAPDSVVRSLGLKSGDIITSINGRQIKTADDAISFYESLKAGDRISIQLKRRGRPQAIEYSVEEEMLSGNMN